MTGPRGRTDLGLRMFQDKQNCLKKKKKKKKRGGGGPGYSGSVYEPRYGHQVGGPLGPHP